MKAVIYARYSSDSQREESIEGQLRECKAFAEKNDITILGSYIDRALSAKTDDRPEFQKMVADSAKRMFDAVIVWKLDRFARNRYDSAHYKRLLDKNNTKVLSATEPISNDSTGILLESMLEGMAEYYSVELAEKVTRGLTENVLKGISNGGHITFGYTRDKDRRFIIDPLTAPIVVEVFEMYDSGMKIKDIRDLLESRGVKNSCGKAYSFQGIEWMLHNRRYIGEYRHGKTVNPGAIPAIVSRELFDSVQAKLAKNAQAPARATAKDDKYLLTTKLFCGTCGVFMAGESGRGRSGEVFRYYKCANAKRGRGCKRKPIRKKLIEDFVIDEIKRFLDDDAMIEDIANELMAAQEADNTVIPFLEKQLVDTDKAIVHMLDAIQQGIFTPSTKQRLEELEQRKESIEVNIANEGIRRNRLTKKQILFWLSRFRSMDMESHEQRQQLIDTFVNAIFVYDDEIVFTFNHKDNTKTVSLNDMGRVRMKKSAKGAAAVSRDEVFEHGPVLPTNEALEFQRSKALILSTDCKMTARTFFTLYIEAKIAA
jgi:DNA invertase Pin-like site-specific DNA recombinase/TolA-binding protein